MSKRSQDNTTYIVGARPPQKLSDKAMRQLLHARVSPKATELLERASKAKVVDATGILQSSPVEAASKTKNTSSKRKQRV